MGNTAQWDIMRLRAQGPQIGGWVGSTLSRASSLSTWCMTEVTGMRMETPWPCHTTSPCHHVLTRGRRWNKVISLGSNSLCKFQQCWQLGGKNTSLDDINIVSGKNTSPVPVTKHYKCSQDAVMRRSDVSVRDAGAMPPLAMNHPGTEPSIAWPWTIISRKIIVIFTPPAQNVLAETLNANRESFLRWIEADRGKPG